MDPNVRNAVRDWRMSILSEGMYMDPSVITEALKTGEGLEEVMEAIRIETNREIQDFVEYGTTGTLPVAEFLQYALECAQEPVVEGDIIDSMKARIKQQKQSFRRAGMGFKNVIRTGGNVIDTGEFDKLKKSLTALAREAKTVKDIDFLMSDRKAALVQLTTLSSNMKSGKVAKNYDVKKLDAYIEWIKDDYYKVLIRRKEELKKQGKMESFDPDDSADESREIAVESITDKLFKRKNSDQDMQKVIGSVKRHIHKYKELKTITTLHNSATTKKGSHPIIATVQILPETDVRLVSAQFNKLNYDVNRDVNAYALKLSTPETLPDNRNIYQIYVVDASTVFYTLEEVPIEEMNHSIPNAALEGEISKAVKDTVDGYRKAFKIIKNKEYKNPDFRKKPQISDRDLEAGVSIVKKVVNKYPKYKKFFEFPSMSAIQKELIRHDREDCTVAYLPTEYDVDDFDDYFDKWGNMYDEICAELVKAKIPVKFSLDDGGCSFKAIVIVTESVSLLAEALSNTVLESGFNPDQRNLNEITPMDGSQVFTVTPWSNAERTVGNALCDICEAETDEEINEAVMHFAMVAEAVNATYEMVTLECDDEFDDVEESIGSAVRGASRKVRRGVRTVARKVDRTARSVKTGAKKAIDPIVALIDKNVAKIKEADASERREIIMRGGIIPKVMRWLKRSIALLIGAGIGAHVPIAALITVITFIGWICSDKYLDAKQRHQILSQLEDEIELVNEKIDDARGDTNKQKKYELMRIRNKLKRTSDKIRYNLKVSAEDDIVQNIKAKKANVK